MPRKKNRQYFGQPTPDQELEALQDRADSQRATTALHRKWRKYLKNNGISKTEIDVFDRQDYWATNPEWMQTLIAWRISITRKKSYRAASSIAARRQIIYEAYKSKGWVKKKERGMRYIEGQKRIRGTTRYTTGGDIDPWKAIQFYRPKEAEPDQGTPQWALKSRAQDMIDASLTRNERAKRMISEQAANL